jgi:hypothetical protein
MAKDWKEYQEEAADFFRGLGLDAETDVILEGVRTKHDIDVVVRSNHVGFDILWLVECKHWKTSVSKLHVLALRQIVNDIGADRGILLCEMGFQSGAIEAANLTNIRVTSLSDFQTTASHQITAMRLRDLFDRTESCKQRYWEITKRDRIEHGLRPEVGGPGYSGITSIDLSLELIGKAFRESYPIKSDSLAAILKDMPKKINSADALLSFVEPLVTELEAKLNACEDAIRK